MICRALPIVLSVVALSFSAAASGTACKGITDPLERLACYDALEQRGELDGSTSASPRNAAGKDDPAFFGVPITQTPNDALNSAEADADQTVAHDDDGSVESITSKVVEYSVSANRMVTVVLANGQVWRQVSGRELSMKDEATANMAKISRTLLGGFSMTINDRKDVAIVKRLDGKRRR